MLKNYFILAWRHLLKNKGYSLINITGLGLGMAIALIIGLYIADEYTFDSYSKNYRRIADAISLQPTPHEPWSTTPFTTTAPVQAARRPCDQLFENTPEVSGPW